MNFFVLPPNKSLCCFLLALPTIYKHGIPLFRSLYSLLRILPVWKLYKRLKRRTGGLNRNGHLGITLRVKPSDETHEAGSAVGILGFGEFLSRGSVCFFQSMVKFYLAGGRKELNYFHVSTLIGLCFKISRHASLAFTSPAPNPKPRLLSSAPSSRLTYPLGYISI